jgi:hypothetical protein
MLKSFVLYSILLFAVTAWLVFIKKDLYVETYQYFYFVLAIGIWFLSYNYFGGRFIRPKWKKVGKLIAYLFISSVLLISIGHYALIFLFGHQLLGGIGHLIICKKNGIDWRTCQPEEKYLALTEKWAKGNFK